MVEIASIASGSNGNCYYIGDEKSAILIDAGISCKQIIERLKFLKIDLSKIKGVFISHEHSDHVRGVRVFNKKTNIPIFMNKGTFEGSKIENTFINFIDNKIISIDNLKIKPFSKNHDANEPISFMVSCENKNISVITDIGKICDNVIEHISISDALFIESNYDTEMLDNGPYPYFLKERIKGEFGHMSNERAGSLILEHASSKLKHVILSHLSQNNNEPKIALNTFNSIIKYKINFKPEINVASRSIPGKIIKL